MSGGPIAAAVDGAFSARLDQRGGANARQATRYFPNPAAVCVPFLWAHGESLQALVPNL